MQTVGSMMAAKQLWEQAIVPSLLSGAGTWVSITPEAEAMCEELQELFWRVMLQVPKSSPKVMLTAETQTMMMKQRIWKMKLMTANGILKKDGTMANDIYNEQMAMSWPGLSSEVKEICQTIGISNLNKNYISKEEIENAVFFHNYKEMKCEMERYRKLEDIKHEDFRKPQNYMESKSVENARMAYRIRCKMVKTFKMNFKNSYKNLKCENCLFGSLDDQSHRDA